MKLLYITCLILTVVSAFHARHGEECSSDDHCLPSWETCSEDGVCKHKDLWPMNQMEFWGMIAVFWTLWVANMGGIGGG